MLHIKQKTKAETNKNEIGLNKLVRLFLNLSNQQFMQRS